MFSFFVRMCACIGMGFFFIAATFADNFFEPRGELTLAAAIDAVLQRNPALQNAAFEVRAANARITQAGLRPNPELALDLENFGGTRAVRGVETLESTLSLSQVIELGGKRSRRVEVAQFGRDNAVLERGAKQLDVLAEVTRRFIDVAADQQQLLLTRRSKELSEKTAEAIHQRVQMARAPEAEKNRATIALGRAKLDEKHAEQILLSAHRRLAALWGSTEPQFGDAAADLFDLPPIANFDALLAQLKSNPDFLKFANTARLRDAEWQLAKADATSNVTVGTGLRRFEETGATGFVFNVSMPLLIANRNEGAIREASIRRDQVQVEEQAAFIDAQAALFEFYQNLQHARSEVTALREQLIPQAEAALAQTRYGYERGRFSYVELADAQRELLELQRDAIHSAAAYHRVLAEIERLTNEPLTQLEN